MTVSSNVPAIEIPSITTRLAQHLSIFGLTAFTALRPASMETGSKHISNESQMIRIGDIQNDQFQFPITATVWALDQMNLFSLSEGVVTNVFTESEGDYPFYDDDFVARPHYTSEFEIRVGSLTIDRSLPKIFLD